MSPNPMVGAVVVRDGEIVSEGYHSRFGGPHAEVNALNKLNSVSAENSTLYINLEPCVHYGKTPPCVDKIIEYGVAKVVIGMVDPNPLVREKGIRKLRLAGIEVEIGIMEKECRRLNEAFIKSVVQKKPYVILKIAQTLDGKIAKADGSSKWITSKNARKRVHIMRKSADSILVGVNTVIKDDPELTVRLIPGKSGKRIILDSSLRIPPAAKVLNDSHKCSTIIATTDKTPADKVQLIRDKGAEVWIVDRDKQGRVDISKLLEKIYENEMISVLVEGGRQIFTSFLKMKETDKIVVFIAPRIFGNGIESFGDMGENYEISPEMFCETAWYKRGEEIIFEGRF